MSYRNSRYNDEPQSKVYVGDLGNDASDRELEDVFGQYGPVKKVWVAQNPPGFAFVEFEDIKDAEDAIKGLDGTTICGRRAKVEMARGSRRRGGGGGFGGGRRGGYGGGGGDDSCYQCGGRGHFARECRNGGGGGGGGYRDSRRRSRSPY